MNFRPQIRWAVRWPFCGNAWFWFSLAALSAAVAFLMLINAAAISAN